MPYSAGKSALLAVAQVPFIPGHEIGGCVDALGEVFPISGRLVILHRRKPLICWRFRASIWLPFKPSDLLLGR